MKKLQPQIFHAVKCGRFRGVFRSEWIAMRAVHKFANPKYQKYLSMDAAVDYVFGVVGGASSINTPVYTDGSYKMVGGDAHCGYGVFFDDEDARNSYGAIQDSRCNTSQKAEAYAIVMALQLQKTGPLEIRTDSLHVVLDMTTGNNRQCRACIKAAPQSCGVFCQLRKIVRFRDDAILWSYVKSHSGIYGNEQADLLSKKGRKLTIKVH